MLLHVAINSFAEMNGLFASISHVVSHRSTVLHRAFEVLWNVVQNASKRAFFSEALTMKGLEATVGI